MKNLTSRVIKKKHSIPQLEAVHSLELHYYFLDLDSPTSPLFDPCPDPKYFIPKNYKITFHSLVVFHYFFFTLSFSKWNEMIENWIKPDQFESSAQDSYLLQSHSDLPHPLPCPNFHPLKYKINNSKLRTRDQVII